MCTPLIALMNPPYRRGLPLRRRWQWQDWHGRVAILGKVLPLPCTVEPFELAPQQLARHSHGIIKRDTHATDISTDTISVEISVEIPVICT